MLYRTGRFSLHSGWRPFRALVPGAFSALALLPVSFSVLASGQVNPAGNVIHTVSTGMGTLKPGDSLINRGGIVGRNPSATGITGMWLQNGGTAENAGYITLSGNGGNVYGVFGDDTGSTSVSGTVGNAGLIAVENTGTATTDTAAGLLLKSRGTASNTGIVKVSSAAGTASGITIQGGTANNAGSITATANKGTAYGIWLTNGGVAVNSGVMTVSGTIAYGIQAGNDGTVANYGVIRVSSSSSGGQAHELGVSGGHVRLADWSLELRDFGDTATSPFHVGNGSTLAFGGSRLILRPGSAAQGFVWGREYAVKDMVVLDNTAVTSHATGGVATVATELPMLEARLTGNDYMDQTVSLHTRVTARNNPGLLAGVQAVENARTGMQHLNSVLAGQLAPLAPAGTGRGTGATGASGLSGQTENPDDRKGWQFFTAPYFSHASNNDIGYSSNTAGLILGATKRIDRQFAAGLHFGHSDSNVSGDLMGMDNSTKTTLLGVHGVFNATRQWYVRGQFTGYLSRYDDTYKSGLAENPLYAGMDSDGYGLFAAFHTGYAFRTGEESVLTPEIGLSALWSHLDKSSLHWKDSAHLSRPAYDMHFDAQDYTAVYGTAMLRWRGDLDAGWGNDTRVRPALGIGVRRTLTDDKIESRMRFAGSGFTTRVTEDRTAVLAEAALEWQSDDLTAGLAYTGEYSSGQNIHTGWVTLNYAF